MTQLSKTATQIDAILSRSQNIASPSIRIIGDSIVSQNTIVNEVVGGSTSQNSSHYPRFWVYLNWLTGNAFNYESTLNLNTNKRVGSNSGIGGDDMTEVLSRLPSILSTMPEEYLFFHVGTNDINGGATFSSLKTNMISLLDTTIAAGITPITSTVLPRNSTDGSNDWGSTGGTTQAQKRLILQAYNQWLIEYCLENNIKCVSWHHVFTGSDGQAISGYTQDGLHPNGIGGYYLGIELQRQIGDLLPKARNGNISIYDDYDSTYNPNGNYLNGAFSGTGGSTSTGGGTGTITGTIPDDWLLECKDVTSTNAVAAIVARTDGKPGNVLELTFTTDGAGTSSDEFRLSSYIGGSTSISGWSSKDDLIQMEAEVEILSGHNGAFKSWQMRVADTGSTTYTASTISFDSASNEIRDSANGLGSMNTGYISVAGSGSNNNAYKVTSVSAGVLTIDSSTPVTDESAGSSITLRNPYNAVTIGASNTGVPDENTPILYAKTPIFMPTRTGNILSRFNFYINGTMTETIKIRIANPKLFKRSITPSLLGFEAHDT